jgi:hypothetical protein
MVVMGFVARDENIDQRSQNAATLRPGLYYSTEVKSG